MGDRRVHNRSVAARVFLVLLLFVVGVAERSRRVVAGSSPEAARRFTPHTLPYIEALGAAISAV